MTEYGHSGIITQPLYHQLQTQMEEFQYIMGLSFSMHPQQKYYERKVLNKYLSENSEH